MTTHTPQAPCDCYLDDDHLMACPLHASAPELLEALQAVARALDADERFPEVRAAIAKAKGA
jgi:hypothetical protein